MGSSLRLSADSRVSLFVPALMAGPKKNRTADQCIRVGGPGLLQARPETAGRSGRRFVRPIPHGGTTLAAGITALGGRRPVMSAGTWPRLRTPPAAARSPAHAFAEPLVCIWLCAFKCGRPPACWQLPGPPFRDVFCPVRAGEPGMPPCGRRRGQAGKRGRPSRSTTCPTRAGSGRNVRGHEKSGGHVPPREVADPKNRG